jgi:hypothetical protein
VYLRIYTDISVIVATHSTAMCCARREDNDIASLNRELETARLVGFTNAEEELG